MVTFVEFAYWGRGKNQRYLWGDAFSWKEVKRKTDHGGQMRQIEWAKMDARASYQKPSWSSGFMLRIWNIFSKTMISEAACVDKIMKENKKTAKRAVRPRTNMWRLLGLASGVGWKAEAAVEGEGALLRQVTAWTGLWGRGDFIYLFLERGEGGRKREEKKHQCVRDTSTWLPLACPHLGTWSAS